jgi:hypothetical protein
VPYKEEELPPPADGGAAGSGTAADDDDDRCVICQEAHEVDERCSFCRDATTCYTGPALPPGSAKKQCQQQLNAAENMV